MDWYVFAADRNVRFGSTFASIHPGLAGMNVSSNALGYDFRSLRAQLFYSLTASTDISTFAPSLGGISTFRTSASTTAGSWFTTTATLPGFPSQPDVDVWLSVVVWDSELSPDALSAVARSGPWGMSSIFTYQIYLPPFPHSVMMVNLQSFDINIPEPSVFALVGLGGLTLAFVRRRRIIASVETSSARAKV
jgi:hypothetical protein